MHEVLQGHASKHVARSLGISEQTVKVHPQIVYRKLRVHRRIDLMLPRNTRPYS
jgi:DNA-binding NarL/FixJ family response regulator